MEKKKALVQLLEKEWPSEWTREAAPASQPAGAWLQLWASQGALHSALHTLHWSSAEALVHSIAHTLAVWASNADDSPDRVVREWSALTNWDATLKLRDEGTLVSPIALEPDGRLRVRRLDTGAEQLLTAEYVF